MKIYGSNGISLLSLTSKRPASHTDERDETTFVDAQITGRVHSDTVLQAARRLDWRFLLPDPRLERVAYLGAARGTLVTSLELFSQKLTMFSPSQVDAYHRAQYDVVVVSKPTGLALEQAAGLVRPGGSLYVEAHGLFWPGRWRKRQAVPSLWQKNRLVYPNDYVTALQRLGLTQVQTLWFWPNFERCTKIIPLDQTTVLQYALAPQSVHAGTNARLKSTGIQWLLGIQWLTQLVPCFGIVASKPSTGA